jgi:hypothetical protein
MDDSADVSSQNGSRRHTLDEGSSPRNRKVEGSGSAWGMAAPPSWDTQPHRQVQAPELRQLVRR